MSLTKRHLYTLSQLEAEKQERLARRIEREQLTAQETERLVHAGLDLSTTRRRCVGRPRKHVRLSTKFGVVQLTPNVLDFDDEFLLAMLREARHEIARPE